MNPTSADTPAPSATRRTSAAAPSKFLPLSEKSPPNAVGVASVTELTATLAEYLSPAELKKIKEAYRFSDEMHLGQVRKSGEPYISHPIAVAEICAEWKLDAQAIMV